MKVLVADDDLIIRTMAEALVTDIGYECDVVLDGSAVAKSYKDYDIILLDWLMPSMDGLEVIQHIRKESPDYPPYIIMLTSNQSYSDHDKARWLGADSVAVKPFDPVKLRALLNFASRSIEKKNGNIVYDQEGVQNERLSVFHV